MLPVPHTISLTPDKHNKGRRKIGELLEKIMGGKPGNEGGNSLKHIYKNGNVMVEKGLRQKKKGHISPSVALIEHFPLHSS